MIEHSCKARPATAGLLTLMTPASPCHTFEMINESGQEMFLSADKIFRLEAVKSLMPRRKGKGRHRPQPALLRRDDGY
jgi:hypothetical protein